MELNTGCLLVKYSLNNQLRAIPEMQASEQEYPEYIDEGNRVELIILNVHRGLTDDLHDDFLAKTKGTLVMKQYQNSTDYVQLTASNCLLKEEETTFLPVAKVSTEQYTIEVTSSSWAAKDSISEMNFYGEEE